MPHQLAISPAADSAPFFKGKWPQRKLSTAMVVSYIRAIQRAVPSVNLCTNLEELGKKQPLRA
jgi:hypothetical protein